jgi:Sortilin, neurotensin receptor 3,
MVVATAVDGNVSNIALYTSVDRQNFQSPKFPPYLKVPSEGYTVLESNTGGVFIDVLQTNSSDKAYGMLFKSNEKGEFMSLALSHTNHGSNGNGVDFQHVPGISGLSIANVVINTRYLDSTHPNIQKLVQTVFTFDDSSTWKSLSAPSVDSRGSPVTCSGTKVTVM